MFRSRLTVPDGWSTSVEGAVLKGDPDFGVLFWSPFTRTYTDSCPSTMIDPPPGPTVEDFAAAWADMPAFNATTPTDISVDGFVGKLVEFTVPDYDEAECAYGDFMLLGDDTGDGYWAQAPNGHHQLRILRGQRRTPVDHRILVPGHLGRGSRHDGKDPRLHPDRLTSASGAGGRVENGSEDRRNVSVVPRREPDDPRDGTVHDEMSDAATASSGSRGATRHDHVPDPNRALRPSGENHPHRRGRSPRRCLVDERLLVGNERRCASRHAATHRIDHRATIHTDRRSTIHASLGRRNDDRAEGGDGDVNSG